MRTIALFQPEKPANTGNIIRLAMALDFHLALIKPFSFELSDKSLRRAGMDYAIGMDIELCDSLEVFLRRHEKDHGFFVTRYGRQVYSDVSFPSHDENQFYMFGKESSGLPKDLLKKHLSSCIRIPMAINARSLNLADSVSIIAGEVNRQQRFEGLATREAIKGPDFILH